MTNLPLISVAVPNVVPFIITDTPGITSSFLSMTTPVICISSVGVVSCVRRFFTTMDSFLFMNFHPEQVKIVKDMEQHITYLYRIKNF